MSVEEAIKNLEIMLDSAQRRTKRNIVIPDLIESIEMAIEALKERKEKEQRGIGIGKPYCIVQVDKDMVKRTIDKAINNLYYKCPYCGAKMNPQRKEERK